MGKPRQVSNDTGVFKPGKQAAEAPARRGRKPNPEKAEQRERMRDLRASRKAALHAVSEPLVEKPEAVAHPAHYNRGKVEIWDFAIDQKMGFLEGNVLKYLTRWRDKDGITDLEKARTYLDKLIVEAKQAKAPYGPI